MRSIIMFSVATILVLAMGSLVPTHSVARSLSDASRPDVTNKVISALAPAYCAATHDVGKIAFGVTNHGVSGAGFNVSAVDCFTGTTVPGCQYPKGSSINYLFASSLWVGAVVDGDTLVSVGADGWIVCREMNPNQDPPNQMIYRSLHGPDSANAISEEDFVSVYTDTFTSGVSNLVNDEIDQRPHRPLSIEVTEKSYAWSTDDVSKVILVELGIRNIGTKTLNDAYVGVLVDGDVGSQYTPSWYADDLTGLLRLRQDSGQCGAIGDTLLVAYISDNNGDMGPTYPATAVLGFSFLGVLESFPKYSYHWWQSNANSAQDYGPRRKDLIRDFGTGGTGTPAGDRNKYFLMSNGEQDFSQIYTASIEATDPNWDYPNQTIAASVSQGNDARFLLSVGPFTIEPQQELPLSYAWVVGDSLHTDPYNSQNLPNNPGAYYANLDFSDLARTVRAARRLYDNPGVDTDSDGYKGRFAVCCIESVLVTPPSTYECLLEDTLWYGGDGVPDFRPITPPCCEGRTGNVNMEGIVDLSDLSALVSYLLSDGYNLPCVEEANVNKAGIVDLSDLSSLVSYLMGGGYVLPSCP